MPLNAPHLGEIMMHSPPVLPLTRIISLGLAVALTATLTALGTAPAHAAPFVNVTPPVISGPAQVGINAHIHVSDRGTWTPVPTEHFTYEWFYDGVLDPTATDQVVSPGIERIGQTVKARVTAHGGADATSSVFTNQIGPLGKGEFSFITPPSITGSAQVGSELTHVLPGFIPAADSVSCVWLADGVPIPDTDCVLAYTPAEADVGKKLSVRYTTVKAGYDDGVSTSAETPVVTAVADPPFESLTGIDINGAPQVGQELNVDTGFWNPVPTTVTHQWLADGVDIPGASGIHYRLVAGDLGKHITVRETVSGPGHADTSITATSVGPVVATAAPTTPAHLRSTHQSTTSLTLAWDAVPGAPKYKVAISRYSDMDDARYLVFDTYSGVVTGLSKDRRYYFRVAVAAANGTTRLTPYTQSPYPTARTDLYDFAAPANVALAGRTSTSLTVTWNSVQGAPQYKLQVSRESDMDDAKAYIVTAAGKHVTGLKRNTRYYMRVSVVQFRTLARLSPYSTKPYTSARTKS